MSERGVFAVDRGIWDHPVLSDGAPFSRREAWLWLLSEAAWKPRQVRIAGHMLIVERGQVAHSLRHMAQKWGWTLKKVRVFLESLKKGTMIGTSEGTAVTVITICNYNDYQRVSLPKGTANGSTKGKRRAHEGHNIENIESMELELPNGNSNAPTARSELQLVLDAEHAVALIQHRKQKRAPLTAHAARLLASKFAKCPDPNAAVDVMIGNGWQGFEPEWLDKRRGQPPPKHPFAEALDRAVEKAHRHDQGRDS